MFGVVAFANSIFRRPFAGMRWTGQIKELKTNSRNPNEPELKNKLWLTKL
jgi:hypothetical protein